MTTRQTPTAWNREDRDLLVELRTEMTGVRADLNDIKGNITGRLLNVEANAVNKIVFDKVSEDHERRIRFLERYGFIGIGALTILEFGIQIYAQFHKI